MENAQLRCLAMLLRPVAIEPRLIATLPRPVAVEARADAIEPRRGAVEVQGNTMALPAGAEGTHHDAGTLQADAMVLFWGAQPPRLRFEAPSRRTFVVNDGASLAAREARALPKQKKPARFERA